MVKIIFESHKTTEDNESRRASGHFDVALSDLGRIQAKELGETRKNEHFDAIYCSDLQRSYKTAEIAFGNKFPVIRDKRLRECDYGDLTQSPSELVESEKLYRVSVPYPNGESFEQTNLRMKSFLDDLKKNYDGKKVLIIGHRATQYGLDHWILGKPLEELVGAKFKWQPGWEYELN